MKNFTSRVVQWLSLTPKKEDKVFWSVFKSVHYSSLVALLSLQEVSALNFNVSGDYHFLDDNTDNGTASDFMSTGMTVEIKLNTFLYRTGKSKWCLD